MHSKSQDGAPNTACNSCRPCCDLWLEPCRAQNKKELVERHRFNRPFGTPTAQWPTTNICD